MHYTAWTVLTAIRMDGIWRSGSEEPTSSANRSAVKERVKPRTWFGHRVYQPDHMSPMLLYIACIRRFWESVSWRM